jgi:formate transporter FocA
MPPAEVPKPVKKSLTQEAGDYGKAKADKSFAQSFGLAVFAGAFIAIAFVFYITVTTGAGQGASWGLVRLAGGVAFSLGLILVVIAGGELFTSTVLTSIAWAQKRISTQTMLGCWARVYAGNFVGAMLMLALVTGGKMYDLDAGIWGLNAMHIAHHKLQHTWVQAFSLGILCNLMVCLGVWMTFATKDVMAKTFLLILPVAMFVSSGFEHSIANMFMVPLGLSIKALVSPEFYTALGSSAHEFADLTIANFIVKNLIPVTLGNIVGGGVFVGIGYWLVDKKPITTKDNTDNTPASAPVTTHTSALKLVSNRPITAKPTNSEISGEKNAMNTAMKKTTVRDLMIANAIVLGPDMTLVETLRIMAENPVRVFPVADTKQRLLGVVSEHDVLRYLWSEEFSAASDWRIRDIMQTDVLTVEPNNSIVDLIEFMTVDRDKLFPVNDSGFITANVYQSYEERLKTARAQRPSVYPVVHQDTLCGVIRRIDIVRHLSALMTEKGVEPAEIRRVDPKLVYA